MTKPFTLDDLLYLAKGAIQKGGPPVAAPVMFGWDGKLVHVCVLADDPQASGEEAIRRLNLQRVVVAATTTDDKVLIYHCEEPHVKNAEAYRLPGMEFITDKGYAAYLFNFYRA